MHILGPNLSLIRLFSLMLNYAKPRIIHLLHFPTCSEKLAISIDTTVGLEMQLVKRLILTLMVRVTEVITSILWWPQ